MSETTLPTPPATAVWWNPTATLDAVLAQLRLTATDVDKARIEALIPAAGRLIDNYLDRPDAILGPPPDPILQGCLEQVTVELYRRKDAPPTSADSLMQEAWRPGQADALAEVRAHLRPFKRRWGIG